MINERAAKIVATLGVTDPQVAERVKTEIAQQYRNLNTIHKSRKEAIKADANQKLTALHREYLAVLSRDLTTTQVDMVKDGMTYRVPIELKFGLPKYC